ncbi:MAG: 2OG-Fe(II) oxygenase [Alphaproteobacteria bacterium]|nr:2OG-Fe(II) oxygenase [Alphaproteobacteria bacterium]
MPQNNLPLIDVTALGRGDLGDADSAAKALCQAFESIGFAYVTGHGVPDDVIEAALRQSREFFESRLDRKNSLPINRAHRGYIPLQQTHLVDSGLGRNTYPNLSESFFVLYDVDPSGSGARNHGFLAGPNQWPQWLPEFEPAVRAFMSAAEAACQRIMTGFSLGLGLGSDGFDSYFTEPTTYLRMLHYPPHPDDADAEQFGQAPHTDFGALTLLAQDGADGLEVRTRDGAWIGAPHLPGTLVVNVADLFPIWTGGRFHSTPHRVINRSGRDRYSLAYFFDPSLNTVVECLPTCQSVESSPHPETLNYGKHAEQRLTRNYAFRDPSGE